MATVDRKAVNQMIVSRLRAQLGAGVWVYAPNEAIPEHDPDQAGDTPVEKWCKVHRVAISPLQAAGDSDHRSLSFTISVGVAPASADASPHLLDETVQLVLEAIEHAPYTHADGEHRMQLHHAESDILTDGQHEADGTGVVSVGGYATRTPV